MLARLLERGKENAVSKIFGKGRLFSYALIASLLAFLRPTILSRSSGETIMAKATTPAGKKPAGGKAAAAKPASKAAAKPAAKGGKKK